MFERTVSFWRQLLGGPSRSRRAESSHPPEEDRRVWVRYPADVETVCQPTNGAGSHPLAARVQNISLGGVNLRVNRPFEPGTLLSVELPGETAQSSYTVLACVVRLTAQPEGEWVLGCTFSRELSDEDLRAFGAKRARPHPPGQRTWQRFPCNVKASYREVQVADPEPASAQVLDISPGGVGLLVDRAVETGALLNVELFDAAGKSKRTMLACVVRVNAQNGLWALGCNFISELTNKDLKALL
jgi:c-di-GMP-binding flagellar brake protein YcgR